MFREDLPPATLLPVPRALGSFSDPQPLREQPAPDDPSWQTPRRPTAVVEHTLAFRVRVVTTEDQLLRVQALRQAAYGRHLPGQAAAFGSADPMDRARGAIVFYAEDKATGQIVGSARIQSNRYAPLQIEGSVELPPQHRGRMLAEITRLCVMPGYDHQVRLAMLKAIHLYCIALQIGGLVAGSRRSLLRTYEALGFVDLYGDERMCPLAHAGNLPHRVLFRDTLQADAQVLAQRPRDHEFVFRQFHPDIEIFDALSGAVEAGLQRRGAAPWPLAA